MVVCIRYILSKIELKTQGNMTSIYSLNPTLGKFSHITDLNSNPPEENMQKLYLDLWALPHPDMPTFTPIYQGYISKMTCHEKPPKKNKTTPDVGFR